MSRPTRWGGGGLSRADADAAYEPVGGESSRLAATALYAKRTAIFKTGLGHLRWLVTGSSVAVPKYYEYATDLAAAVGGYAGSINGAGGQNPNSPRSAALGITTNASSGTVTANTTDYTSWWSGVTTSLASGASVTWGNGGGNAIFDTCEIIYIGGTGTFTVQVGAGTAQAVDTSTIPAGQVGFYAVTGVTRAQQAIVVTATAGTPKLVGPAFWDTTVPGLLPAYVGQGGISLGSATANAWANYTRYLQRYLPDVITWEMKQGQWTGPQLITMLEAIKAGAPNADVILLGSTPDSSSDTAQLAANALINTTAATYRAAGLNVVFFDGFTPLRSWARVNALGWGGDGTHLSWQPQQYLASLLMRDLGVYQAIGGLSPFDVNAQRVLGARIGAGRVLNPAVPLEVTGSDTSSNAVGRLRTLGTGGQSAILQLWSGFSGGSGDAEIEAALAELRLKGSVRGGTGSAVVIQTAGGERLRVDSVGKVLLGGTSGPSISKGTGTPEGAVAAPVGSIYLRTDGGAGTSFYVKESGTGNTGWTAK